MSRYCGTDSSEAVLRAAQHWRESCLLQQRSIFGSEQLWNLSALRQIEDFFVKRPDEGRGTFLDKLREQLRPAAPQAKRLAAEMMWVLYLCPSSLTPRHKSETVGEIWSWSGTSIASDSPWLDHEVLEGVGSAGPGFNQNQWRELAFFTNLLQRFYGMEASEREALLRDGWAFNSWLRNVADWENRQSRHMVLYLLFPDDFERIFGGMDRRTIVSKFSGLPIRQVSRLTPYEIDEKLRDIRAQEEAKYHTKELDFYVPPLADDWKAGSSAEVIAAIKREHLIQAMHEIDNSGVPPDAESSTYDVVHEGKRYPPKLVVSIAARFATGDELDRGTFAGGEGTPAFRLLTSAGFQVAGKEVIKELLERFLAQAEEGNSLVVQGYLRTYRDLAVKVSFGVGNVARIPWIAFLMPGQTVSDGIYPVFLLFKEARQLLLCYGISETNQPESTWNVSGATTVHDWFQRNLGRNPDRYGESLVRSAYSIDKPLPFAEINRELDHIIDEYGVVLGTPPPEPAPAPEVRANLAEATVAFSSALRSSALDFGSAHEALARSFVASIVTKPFIILTGLSGSGKTQIAIRFGEWIGPGRLHTAAVRPDWTGAEALFGYEDALRPTDVAGRAAWAVPQPLEFMLRAARDPDHPYLLLLDEMNLAHVERYFADVLSGMESSKECLPNLAKGPDGVWRLRADEPARIPYPRNVWIVGTVNVDETTYMFSPKVLDRANTFEFRVSSESLNAVARKPGMCQAGDQALVRGLLAIARDDGWHLENPPSFGLEITARMRQLHALLARYGMEFGHRTFYESIRFAAVMEAAGTPRQSEVLDRIVLQKVLPRLHGARRRIEAPILALLRFCRDLPDSNESDGQLQSQSFDDVGGAVALPLSFEKLHRMLRSLQANQFVSFAE